MANNKIIFREKGLCDYSAVWQAMRDFTLARTTDTVDEIWFLEHQPVFTQGQAGRPQHIIDLNSIPLVQTDRGGQVTYHGPGQLIMYTLVDLKRRKWGVKKFVYLIEQIVIDMLTEYGVASFRKDGAPGIFIKDEPNLTKIASIGLKICHGCSYHGVAINVANDLAPFQGINPCGFKNLAMARLIDLSKQEVKMSDVIKVLTAASQKIFAI